MIKDLLIDMIELEILVMKYCPRWLFVLLILSHIVWLAVASLYPFMALTAFYVWWSWFWKTLAVPVLGWLFCGVWAWVVKVKHG